MNYLKPIKVVGFVLYFLIGFFPAKADPSGLGRAGDRPPNIILIVADDLGYGDLGCYGQQLIRTRFLDSLAGTGMRFTSFYSGSTVCAPSRESLLTGMHTGHTFIKGNFDTGYPEGDLSIPDSTKTIAEYLREAGYRTAVIGKWGIGSPGQGPNTQGFDYSFCYLDQISAHNYYPPHLYENEVKVPLPRNQGTSRGSYSHDLFVEKTLAYIGEQKEQPFFLYLPFTIPHGEHVVPDDTPYTETGWPRKFRNYAAMITRLDRDIGRITRRLKEMGKDENTLILFTSDNGANPAFADFFQSNGPFRGAKRDLYEGGIRVPLIASWPGRIAPGTVSDRVAAAWDLLPTLCEAAGLPLPEHTDGLSLLPELFGKEGKTHGFLYWEYYAYNWNWYREDNTRPRNWLESQAVRMGKWKAVKTGISVGETETLALYDLSTDPGEKHDLSADYPDLVKKANRIMREASSPAIFFPYADSLHVIRIDSPDKLKDFFRYTTDRVPLVSAHRGGARPGFPENCIATFENTLRHTPAILEVDPRYTRDSVIVLMHDATLDRTTNGTGKVADHTWEELQKLRLKDTEGNLTPYRIPSLEEALQWARGKTVLVLDQKDVPMEARARLVTRMNAESHAMLIVYSYQDAKRCFELNSKLMMEVMIPHAAKAAEFDSTGVPWENIIAFVGHERPENRGIYQLIHQKGAMCVVGSSRIYDRKYLEGDRRIYQNLIGEGVDIIEADLAIETGAELRGLHPAGSSKQAYFHKIPSAK